MGTEARKLTDLNSICIYSHGGWEGGLNVVLAKFKLSTQHVEWYDIYILLAKRHLSATFFSLFLELSSLSHSIMAKSGNRRGPVQRRKEKDEQEWTTPEEKVYLQSKQAEYSMARDKKTLKAWFTVELKAYFNKFPMQPVTEEEKLKKGSSWSFQDK
jgi:hypothetical protein